ncbi:MAG: CvpA family protein [Salinispira sp.]
MNPLDIICILLLLVFIVRGLIRGFVTEFSAIAAILAGVLIASFFSGIAASVLDQYLEPSFWNQVIAFLSLFIVTYLIVKLFEAGLKSLIEKANLTNLNKALGVFLGLLEGFSLIFIAIFILQLQPFIQTDTLIAESLFATMLQPLFPYARQLISQE